MRREINKLRDDRGKTRVITKFLWFPKILENQFRWLEKAKIIQIVCKVDIGQSEQWGKYRYKWLDIAWDD